MLEKVAHFNDLSVGLRKKIKERIKGYGSPIRYKFDLGRENPDPEKKGGKIIFPLQYTLDPAVFDINDEDENREGVSARKKIGIVKATDDKGVPVAFIKIKLKEGQRGMLELDPKDLDDLEMIALLELHPKHKGGMFCNNKMHQLFERVDVKKYNEEKRSERTLKLKALNAAMDMSEKEVRQFADAMIWDSTEEESALRAKVEELADNAPDLFNDLVAGKSIEYQATIKQAMDRKIIAFDPAEYKFIWSSNQQPLAILQPTEGKSEVQKLSEWFQVSGQEPYKKLKSLLTNKS
jgi:hypothetical protein